MSFFFFFVVSRNFSSLKAFFPVTIFFLHSIEVQKEMHLLRTMTPVPPDTKRRKRRRGGMRRRTDLAKRGPASALTNVTGAAGMARRGKAISDSAALTKMVLLTIPNSHAPRTITSSVVTQVCSMTCF